MKIESLKIITGTPEEVAAQAQAYLDEHPNSQILGTSVTMKRGPVIEEKTPEPVKDKETAKKPAVNAATGATPPVAPEELKSAVLNTVEYGPDEPVVALTLGRIF
jgi:hypothetical protein